MPTRNLPKREKIYNFWQNKLLNDHNIEIGDPDTCFACGSDRFIHRAHIHAKCDGGPDNVDNLHLLCSCCHAESELLSISAYWNWLKYKNAHEFDLGFAHTLKIIEKAGYTYEEFESVYNKNGKDAAISYILSFFSAKDETKSKFKKLIEQSYLEGGSTNESV